MPSASLAHLLSVPLARILSLGPLILQPQYLCPWTPLWSLSAAPRGSLWAQVCSPTATEEPPGPIEPPTPATLLVVSVTGQQILRG